MSSETSRRVRSFVDGIDVPPGQLADVVARANAPRRVRRWTGPVVVAVAVGVTLLAMTALGPSFRGDVGAAAAATLPDRFARYSYLTADVSESPPGRAIAVYQQGLGVELFDAPQAIALGADGDVYRLVDVAGARGSQDPAPMVLSPDGRRVAVGTFRGAGDLAVVDLTTGQVEVRPARAGANVLPLAWSPDGRYLAALEVDGLSFPVSGPLVLYDLRGSGEPLRLAGFPAVWRAAFSPDGTTIAVQRTGAGQVSGEPPLAIIDFDGTELRTLAVPDGFALASNSAWSPDGRLIALGSRAMTAGPPDTATFGEIRFVDATGAGGPVPGPFTVDDATPPIGWSAPDRLLLRRGPALVEARLATGELLTLATLDSGPASNYLYAEMSLATGLLPGIQVRPAVSWPDRGPWPAWLRVALVVAAAAVAALALGAARRWTTRRRRRPCVEPR